MSEHKKKYKTRRVLAIGAAGALVMGASVAGFASASSTSSSATASATAADQCTDTISFAQSDTSAAAGTNTRHVATGDLDGDGNQDLVAANLDGNSVTVLLGNGDGTFATATAYTTPGLPVAVGTADLDADGNTDVLVSSLNGTSVTLFQGASDGTLTELSELTAAGAYDAQAVDLNGDGTQDIAVADSSADQVDIFTGSCAA